MIYLIWLWFYESFNFENWAPTGPPASRALLLTYGFVISLYIGLTSDDQNLHGERIKLWNDFNHAWLAMFQRQKEMLQAEQPPPRPQTMISQEGLIKMGKELVRLCDSIERHGLVDYQYGVWEEQIIDSESLFPPRF